MKIIVNTRFLIKNNLEGIGIFTLKNLERITRWHPEHEFIFLFDRPFDNSFIFSDNVRGINLFPPARHPFLWYTWFEYSVSKILKKEKPDLFLSTDGYLSLKAKCKNLVVIHDLSFEHFPKDIPWLVNKYYKHYVPKFAQKADRIATVSEFSKNDIIEKYKIEKDKIDVVYNGVDSDFSPLSSDEKIKVREQLTCGMEYFIYVGAIHPRKNIINLVKAFELFKIKTNSETKLVIIGRNAWDNEELEILLQKCRFKDDIIFTGKVIHEKLNNYLASAKALTYVSYFEGFGIPIIEAMKSDIPVITSNISSMPEVIGNAGLLVNPFSFQEIANAMEKIDLSPTLCIELIEKGRIQREKFSWDKTALKLWDCIEKTVNK